MKFIEIILISILLASLDVVPFSFITFEFDFKDLMVLFCVMVLYSINEYKLSKIRKNKNP